MAALAEVIPSIKERPILFSGAMVRAILDGRKTQTRRVVKSPDATCYDPRPIRKDYEVGMRLWVRERVALKMPEPEFPRGVAYWEGDAHRCSTLIHWRPSIHMPRWACRLNLEIINVRVDRLQEISGEDVLAEGIDNGSSNPTMGERWHNQQRMAFEALWDSINGKTFPWQSNPWVWVVEFKKL